MSIERRRPAFDAALLIRVGMAWAVIALILAATDLAYRGAAPTALIAPLLMLGCALLLAGRIAWRLCNDEVTGLTCLAMALSVPVIAQFLPARDGNQAGQIVLALAAMNGLMERDARPGGWICGAALAGWLALSIEAAPLVLAIVVLVAVRWRRGRAERAWLAHTLQALAVVSAVLFAVGTSLGHATCGGLAPVHLAMLGWAALVISALAASPPQPLPLTLAGFALALGGAVALGMMWPPPCAIGWASGAPLWRQPWSAALQIVLPGLVAIAAALALATRSHDWLGRWWSDYALLLTAGLALAVVWDRYSAVTGALAAIPLGWQLREWMRAARNQHAPSQRAASLAGLALAMLPTLPLTLYLLIRPV